MNILFVCSRNQWRSPTAEAMYKNRPDLQVKSAGTEPSARIRVTAKQIQWADLIFVMEKKHRQRIHERFPMETEQKKIIVLDIDDNYQFMDAGLIEEIAANVNPYLQNI